MAAESTRACGKSSA